MAIRYAGQTVELREVVLQNMPAAMTDISPKATVPVLQLPDGSVIDESLDIMRWALARSDPTGWMTSSGDDLIEQNDGQFKYDLDRYKYPDRYPEKTATDYRQHAERFLLSLESRLGEGDYLHGNRVRLTDIAIFPFIRQFAFVGREWFEQAPYPAVRRWLHSFLEAELFDGVMLKFEPWHTNNDTVLF